MSITKSKTWLALTIILGLITTFLLVNYLKGIKANSTGELFTTVVVANQRIPEGTRLTSEMLKTIELPKKNAANTIPALDKAINQVTTVTLVPEEVILKDQLASSNTTDLPYKLPEGTRAVTIAVNATSGVAGLIKPGHLVDVLLTYKKPAEDENRTVTLLQKILVLAVGSDLQKKDGEQAAETITLAVNSDGAELVALGENIGKLKLVLRPAADDKTNSPKPVDRKTLQSLYP
jgi:pilus assembly protein CpaB